MLPPLHHGGRRPAREEGRQGRREDGRGRGGGRAGEAPTPPSCAAVRLWARGEAFTAARD